MKRMALFPMALGLAFAGCSEEPAPEAPAAPEQGGEAVGDVQGGSISDAMIPLESLRSQSPTIRRQTTVTTTSDADEATQTTVETTTVTTTGNSEAPAPATPEPPTPPPTLSGGRL